MGLICSDAPKYGSEKVVMKCRTWGNQILVVCDAGVSFCFLFHPFGVELAIWIGL